MNPKQPFWTSKAFWTLALGFVFNMLKYFNVIDPSIDAVMLIDSALLILSLVFRWGADQSLTIKTENGTDVKKLR